jgi:hypothetical protein
MLYLVLAPQLGLLSSMEGDMENQITNRDLALTILQRLSDLEIENYAMAELLNNCWDVDKQQGIYWRPLVDQTRARPDFRQSVLSSHDSLRERLQVSTSDCPEALSLLASIAKYRV